MSRVPGQQDIASLTVSVTCFPIEWISPRMTGEKEEMTVESPARTCTLDPEQSHQLIVPLGK